MNLSRAARAAVSVQVARYRLALIVGQLGVHRFAVGRGVERRAAVVAIFHREAVMKLKQLYSGYQQNKDLISVGAYQRGSDPKIDKAISMIDEIRGFLCQRINEKVDMQESIEKIEQIMQTATKL